MICFSNTAGHLYQIVSNHNPMKFYICHWSLYLVISPMIVLIYVKSWLSMVFIMLYDNPDYYGPSKLYEMSLWDVHMSSLGSVVGDKVKWKTALNTYIKTLFLIILYVLTGIKFTCILRKCWPEITKKISKMAITFIILLWIVQYLQ